MARVALLVIVSLLAPTIPLMCAGEAPAAHACCRKAVPAPKAARMLPCCTAQVAPAPVRPAMTSPLARIAPAPLPHPARPVVLALERTGAFPIAPALAYLRHVALLI